MARRLIVFFLFVFSAFVIVAGGYNCAQQQNPGGVHPTGGPITGQPPGAVSGGGDGTAYQGPGGPSGLPEETETKCAALHREFKSYGAPAVLKTSNRALRDYLMGHETNYGLECARVYVDMEKMESQPRLFEGQIVTAYYGPNPEDGSVNEKGTGQVFETGDSYNENRFNTWRGEWGATPTASFAAIMESRHSALIFRIDRVRRLEAGDGKQSFRGSGSLWFKMFRQYKNKTDICHNEGGYARFARGELQRNKVCWLLDRGPYSCLPAGTGTLSKFTTLRRSLPCYRKLADFGYLSIRKAFNIEAGEREDAVLVAP